MPCGLGNRLGNKGAVAVSLCVGGTSFLFLNCHLAANQRRTAQRNADYRRIESLLPLRPPGDAPAVVGSGGGGSSSGGGGGGDDLQLDGAVEGACSAALAAVRPALWLLSAARCPCAPVRSALLQLLTPTLRGLGALAGARPLERRVELPGWGGRLPERGGEGVWRG